MREAFRTFATLCVAALTLAATTGLAAPAAPGQEQKEPPSLGEVARRLRAQKPATPSTAKVWTNDNLPRNPFGISVVGQPPPPPEEKTDVAAPKPAPKPGTGKTLAEVTAQLAEAQQELETKAKELDLAKRDFALLQQGYYTNPMASQDAQVQAQLADAQKKIDSLQQDVDTLRAHIAELQQKVEELKKASPAPPQPPGTTPPAN